MSPTPEDEHLWWDMARSQLWLPILTGLSRTACTDNRLGVRTAALNALFEVLGEHGLGFESVFWHRVFAIVLFPMFAELKATHLYANELVSFLFSYFDLIFFHLQ